MTDDTPPPTVFGAQLKARRIGKRLSVRQAATKAGLKSHGRWSQVEAGWVSVKGEKVRTDPSPEFVVKAAVAVGWDPHDALRTAGHDPDLVVLPTGDADKPPRTLEDLWVKLTDQQREALYNLARLFVYPESQPEHHTPTPETQQRPVPPVLFSVKDTDDTGQ